MAETIYKDTRSIFQNSPQFIIPRYQREYSWQASQIIELLSDIDAIELIHKSAKQINCKTNHFVGLLVFIDDAEDGETSSYSVVDGQQRLSTLSLIASAAKDIITSRLTDGTITQEMSEKLIMVRSLFDEYIYMSSRPFREKSPKLIPNKNDKDLNQLLVLSEELFETKKQKIIGSIGKRGLTSRYYKSYQQIYEFLLDRVQKIGDSYLPDFFVKFDQGLQFIPFIAKSDTDAFNLFECLNDRGLSLSAMDLIKNKVLQKAEYNQIDEFESRWLESIGGYGNIPTEKAQQFIRNLLMIKKGHVKNSDVYEVCKSILVDNQAADSFLVELNEFSSYFRDITEISTLRDGNLIIHVSDDQIAEVLFLLNKSKVKQWQSLGLVAYSLFKTGFLDKKTLIKILNLLLRLCIRFKFLNKRFNLIELAIPKIANKLYLDLKQNPENEHVKIIDEFIHELEQLINEHASKEELEAVLDNGFLYEDNDFSLLLLRLIARETGAIPHGMSFSKTLKITLEHVLPEKHEQFWGAIDKSKELKYSIGNMLLIELVENSRLSNRNFEEKKEMYIELNALDLIQDQSLRYENATQDSWINELIKKREFKLVGILKEII